MKSIIREWLFAVVCENVAIVETMCYNIFANADGLKRESESFMNWGEIILSLFLDLILTVFFYLLVPVIFCIRKKSMTKKQIKKVIIINGVCVCLFFGILAGRVTAAVFLWSWVGKKIMERVLLLEDDGNNHLQENQTVEPAIVNKPIAFCRKCGTKLNDNNAFCSKCGTKVADK